MTQSIAKPSDINNSQDTPIRLTRWYISLISGRADVTIGERAGTIGIMIILLFSKDANHIIFLYIYL